MELTHVELIKLLVSLAIGSAIGAEREYRSKSAGFRTIILITMGSTLFTIFSIQLGGLTSPERIASNIVTGIGFLGAGVIFREEERVNGITTATTIWVAAALGMGVGGGYFTICVIATVLVLCVLYGFILLEKRIDAFSRTRKYRIVCKYEQDALLRYEILFREYKLHAFKGQQSKRGEEITGNWIVRGTASNHKKLIPVLLKDERIIEFDF
ncbi:MAG: MgtC/SapB family protein [Bacteroidetes bacterium]|nr:MgtC/SapB family protein [Bacteroidota bacterium]